MRVVKAKLIYVLNLQKVNKAILSEMVAYGKERGLHSFEQVSEGVKFPFTRNCIN